MVFRKFRPLQESVSIVEKMLAVAAYYGDHDEIAYWEKRLHGYLAKELGVKTGNHTCMGDIEATEKLLHACLKKLGNIGFNNGHFELSLVNFAK